MIETPSFCHSLIRPQKSPPLVPRLGHKGMKLGKLLLFGAIRAKTCLLSCLEMPKGELGGVAHSSGVLRIWFFIPVACSTSSFIFPLIFTLGALLLTSRQERQKWGIKFLFSFRNVSFSGFIIPSTVPCTWVFGVTLSLFLNLTSMLRQNFLFRFWDPSFD